MCVYMPSICCSCMWEDCYLPTYLPTYLLATYLHVEDARRRRALHLVVREEADVLLARVAAGPGGGRQVRAARREVFGTVRAISLIEDAETCGAGAPAVGDESEHRAEEQHADSDGAADDEPRQAVGRRGGVGDGVGGLRGG